MKNVHLYAVRRSGKRAQLAEIDFLAVGPDGLRASVSAKSDPLKFDEELERTVLGWLFRQPVEPVAGLRAFVRQAKPKLEEHVLREVVGLAVAWEGADGLVPVAEFRGRFPGPGPDGVSVHLITPAGSADGRPVPLTREQIGAEIAAAVARRVAALDARARDRGLPLHPVAVLGGAALAVLGAGFTGPVAAVIGAAAAVGAAVAVVRAGVAPWRQSPRARAVAARMGAAVLRAVQRTNPVIIGLALLSVAMALHHGSAEGAAAAAAAFGMRSGGPFRPVDDGRRARTYRAPEVDARPHPLLSRVVRITVHDPDFEDDDGTRGPAVHQSTGVIHEIDGDAHVLTNRHAVADALGKPGAAIEVEMLGPDGQFSAPGWVLAEPSPLAFGEALADTGWSTTPGAGEVQPLPHGDR